MGSKPQAKDVPEDVILEVLRRNPGKWHTHYSNNGHERSIISIPDTCPQLAAFPLKVLHAKLESMAKRGLIGGGGHWESRGDWCVDE